MRRLICNYTLRNPMLFVLANVMMVISALGGVALPMICGTIIDDIKAGGSLTTHSV